MPRLRVEWWLLSSSGKVHWSCNDFKKIARGSREKWRDVSPLPQLFPICMLQEIHVLHYKILLFLPSSKCVQSQFGSGPFISTGGAKHALPHDLIPVSIKAVDAFLEERGLCLHNCTPQALSRRRIIGVVESWGSKNWARPHYSAVGKGWFCCFPK